MRWSQQTGKLVIVSVLVIIAGVVLVNVWRFAFSGQTPSLRGDTATPVAASGTQDPDAVHEQWVTALQYDNRATVVALSTPQDRREALADADLQMMRRYVPAEADTGGVKMVELQPVIANGDERVGTSVWTFVKSKACFQAILTQQDGNWRVRQWQRIPCR